ncbi:type II toxin-antitoxin system PemK/MazF family toxin [Alkalibacillus sp. S2W]|uniref:type II toxin-antitoxin system PemK/MazF family toxin n=1 Tax=Alkalibacillus sp. S2W TaxID=3386553 RepID=UPI00398CBF9E
MENPSKDDLIYINFNPQAETRPAIVLSPETFNKETGFAIVCPITNQQKGYPFEVTIPDDQETITGVVLTDQVKSLDWKARNIKVIEQTKPHVVNKCISNIRKILPLED